MKRGKITSISGFSEVNLTSMIFVYEAPAIPSASAGMLQLFSSVLPGSMMHASATFVTIGYHTSMSLRPCTVCQCTEVSYTIVSKINSSFSTWHGLQLCVPIDEEVATYPNS